ncbi:MAG: 4Fe-4S binding protein [Formivibrio sp.]|nr:4Fe-4S binding protein [Formivibrio sp.]
MTTIPIIKITQESATAAPMAQSPFATRRDHFLARLGIWMRDHRFVIQAVQWIIVGVYAFLLIVPVYLPLPDETAHLWNNLTVVAQFAFWGIWWPFVLVSMVLMGRVWCGVMCPEGALSELASRYSLNLPIPRWMRWSGWPVVGFVGTTVYGQMISVYQYPQAALLILGGSTVAAIAIGLVFAQNRRVWCRYLCPVTGVFGLLAKLSPIHFRTDEAAWKAAATEPRGAPVVCAPLLPLSKLESSSSCHNCGRCADYRGAIQLASRESGHEIVVLGKSSATGWQTLLLLGGMIGLAMGAFHWSASPWFIAAKQWAAEWLINHDILWPLQTNAPWWMFTHYAENNDVFSWLDGSLLLAYIFATAIVLGGGIALLLYGAAWSLRTERTRQTFYHLSQALIPLAGCGVFLGLSAQTITLLRADGVDLDWVSPLRISLLVLASLWSLWLGERIARQYATQMHNRLLSNTALILACGAVDLGWSLLFWIW